MNNLEQNIEKKRNLKQSSIHIYIINIKKIHRYINQESDDNMDFLKNKEKIMEYLSTKAISTQKNYISSIIIALDSSNTNGEYDNILEIYRKLLIEYIEKYNIILEKNKEHPRPSLKELRKVINVYKSELMERNAFSNPYMNEKNFELLQKYVVGSLYSTTNTEPLPIFLEYGDMEIITKHEYKLLSEDQLDTNNYLIVKSRNTKIFHIAGGKSPTLFRLIPIGKKLNSILNIWLKYNKSDNFLLDSKGNIMSSNQLSKYLLKVFKPTGKKISATLLRQIHQSER